MEYVITTRRWWRRLAASLGGQYRHSFWSGRRRVTVERRNTLVSIGVRSSSSAQMAVFEAPFLLPAGPRLRLLAQGTLRMWIRQFGYQDIEIGDGAFDLQFIVKGEPEDEVRTVLRAGSGPLTTLRNVRSVHANGERIRIVGGYLDEIDWERWIAVTADMATADLFGIEALRSVPDAELRWPEPPAPPIATVRVPTPVEITCRAHRGVARTFARARVSTEMPAFDGVAGEGSLPVHIPKGIDGRLRCDGTVVELVWPGVCTDPDELLHQATCLAQLVAGRGVAPYR